MPAKKVRCRLAEFCRTALQSGSWVLGLGNTFLGIAAGDSSERIYLPTPTRLIWFSLMFPMN